jgi:cell wall-associated NlpC family hydrolase
LDVEKEQRAAVVAEAKSWLMTPYHHKAAVKGAGADCAMFPLAVYRAVMPARFEGLVVPTYPHDWHQHKDLPIYRDVVASLAHSIAPEVLQPGDFVLYRFGRVESHGAIALGEGMLIHSQVGLGVTLQEANAQWLRDRSPSFWSLWP